MVLFDMIGILYLKTSSFFPGVYHGFYCEPEVTRTYWSMVRILSEFPWPFVSYYFRLSRLSFSGPAVRL